MKELLAVYNIDKNTYERIECFDKLTPVRFIHLDFYSTPAPKFIHYFNLKYKCDRTSEMLNDYGLPFRLERVHKYWQLTKYYVINKVLFLKNDKLELMYHIESEDKLSNLLVPDYCIEELTEYSSNWEINS